MKKNLHLFLSYAIPSVIAMLIVGSYNIVDSVFIGQYGGPRGLAAVAMTWPLVMMFGALGDMLGTGAAVIISQSRGRGDVAHARRILGTTLLVQVLCAAVLILPTLYFLPDILVAFGTTPDLMDASCEYARVLIYGCMATILIMGTGPIIRNDNRPVLAMVFVVIGLLMNMLLDYVLIFVCDMGLRGAAWATIVSQAIGAIIQSAYFATRYTRLRFGRDMLKISTKNVRAIVTSGMPSFGSQIAIITMLFLHNFQALRYGGTDGVAIYTFIGAIESLGALFMTGLALGVQPLAAFMYGRKNYVGQNAIGNLGYMFAAIFGLLLMTVLIVGRDTFPHWFNLTGELAPMAARGLAISACMFLVFGLVRVAGYYYQATGKIRQANMLIYGDAFVALPLCLFTLPMFFGLDGVWMAMPASRLLLFMLVCWFWWGDKIKRRRA